MKTTIRVVALMLVLTMTVFMFAACGNISESYAEKINKAAKDGEALTYEEVKEDLGEDVVDITFLETGVLIAVKGCASVDDIKEKLDDGKTVKGVYVVVTAGKAVAAEYREITADDLK